MSCRSVFYDYCELWNSHYVFSALKMELLRSSETLILTYKITIDIHYFFLEISSTGSQL